MMKYKATDITMDQGAAYKNHSPMKHQILIVVYKINRYDILCCRRLIPIFQIDTACAEVVLIKTLTLYL